MRSSYQQAQKYVKDNKAQVEFQCGDFNKNENYWDVSKNQPQLLESCLDLDCPESLYKGSANTDAESELHVLSVEKPWPYRWEGMSLKRGNFVDVKIAQKEKPLKLVLVSQAFMLWDLDLEVGSSTFKEEVKSQLEQEPLQLSHLTAYIDQQNWNISYPRPIDEVIVISPELVWIEGLEASTKVTYFNQDQLCAYPIAWEEISNPENQFRRLTLALKAYTGLDISSFQGREIGRKFKLPFRNLLAETRDKEKAATRSLASTNNNELGLQWKREGEQLKATSYKYKRDGQIFEMDVPEKTTQAYFEMANSSLFLINNHQFGTWNAEDKKFEPLHLPLRMPAMYWPRSLTFNPLTSDILVYNDDRGGEIFAYNVVTSTWRMFAWRVGYSLMAIHFDTDQRKLIGARYSGRKIKELVVLNEKGEILAPVPLGDALDFSKNRWHAHLTSKGDELWLKVFHPAQPQGDLHSLQGT